MHNSKHQCHMAACCTYHLAAKQKPYKKAYLLTENIEEFSGKKYRRKDQLAEKDNKTKRVTGLGRRTREEIAKWNQMTPLRFQTEGRHQTSPVSLWGHWYSGREKCWIDNIKEWTLLSMPELLTMATSHRKDWTKISTESSLLSPHHP